MEATLHHKSSQMIRTNEFILKVVLKREISYPTQRLGEGGQDGGVMTHREKSRIYRSFIDPWRRLSNGCI